MDAGKEAIYSWDCLHGGRNITAQLPKNMEKHHLSILALGMRFQEAERELISVIGVCVMEQGRVREEPQALNYSLAKAPEVFPRRLGSFPSAGARAGSLSSAAPSFNYFFFILIRSEDTLRGALVTESVSTHF